MRALAVPRVTINLQKLLEEGKYGRVYIAKFKGQNTVMVKTLAGRWRCLTMQGGKVPKFSE